MKRFVPFLAPWLDFKRALFWGVIGILVILFTGRIIGSIQATLREWWGSLFAKTGIHGVFYPGMEVPLTVMGGFVLGGLIVALIDLLAPLIGRGGIPVLYERYGIINPGIVRAVIPRPTGSDFPYEHLLQIFPPLRSFPEPSLVVSNHVWVVTGGMKKGDFGKLHASSSIIVPDQLPFTVRWSKWWPEHREEWKWLEKNGGEQKKNHKEKV